MVTFPSGTFAWTVERIERPPWCWRPAEKAVVAEEAWLFTVIVASGVFVMRKRYRLCKCGTTSLMPFGLSELRITVGDRLNEEANNGRNKKWRRYDAGAVESSWRRRFLPRLRSSVPDAGPIIR